MSIYTKITLKDTIDDSLYIGVNSVKEMWIYLNGKYFFC